MIKKHIIVLLLIYFFNCFCGNSSSIQKQGANEQLKNFDVGYLKKLPIPVRNKIAYFAYCNELKERSEKKDQYEKVNSTWNKHAIVVINDQFIVYKNKEVSYNYPFKLKSYDQIQTLPKIVCIALVGWKNSSSVKIIKADRFDRVPELTIDYYEDATLKKLYNYKQDKICCAENVIDLSKFPFFFKIEQLQAITISRDKNKMFLLEELKDLNEYQRLYIFQKYDWPIDSTRLSFLAI